MKEEIVAFVTAKLAKEVGFQNKTPHKLRKNYYNYLGELNGDCTAYLKRFANAEDTSEFVNVEAPTQSLLQRWLREVPKLHIDYEYGQDVETNVMLHCFVLKKENLDMVTHHDNEDYYKGLEFILQEALKLIKQ